MIMIDELVAQPHPAVGRIFGGGRLSCHLTTDGSEEELHEFAKKIGLRRDWFHENATATHCDLTAKTREKALKAGASFVRSRVQAKARMERRRTS